jgi:D-arabinose 1-dehydrogenase-like Zn-dependent alcohol dehydrogenase
MATTATAGPVPPLQHPAPSLTCMRAVQITRFGGPEVLDVVDIAEPEAGPGQKLYDVSTAGVNYADTHHRGS